MVKKKILISVKNNPENYVNAVTGCGAVAVGQYCPEFSDKYDGLIVSGGVDVAPVYYNEEVNGSIYRTICIFNPLSDNIISTFSYSDWVKGKRNLRFNAYIG